MVTSLGKAGSRCPYCRVEAMLLQSTTGPGPKVMVGLVSIALCAKAETGTVSIKKLAIISDIFFI
jgi:hypothetical protein